MQANLGLNGVEKMNFDSNGGSGKATLKNSIDYSPIDPQPLSVNAL